MDIILRSVTVTLLMVMTIGVIAKPQPWRWAACFVAVAIGTATFVATNTSSDNLAPTQWSAWRVLGNFLNKSIVISVWLFVQSSFDDQFRFDKLRVGVTLAWLVIILKDIWLLETGRDDPLGFTTITFAVALMAHLIWTLLRDRDGDLRLGRRTARIWIATVMVGLLLMDIIIDLTMGFTWRPDGFTYVQNGLILMAVLAFAAATLRLDTSKIAPKPPTPEEDDQPLSNNAAKLKYLMTEEHLYLRPNSLASFQRAFKRETGQTASEWRAK